MEHNIHESLVNPVVKQQSVKQAENDLSSLGVYPEGIGPENLGGRFRIEVGVPVLTDLILEDSQSDNDDQY